MQNHVSNCGPVLCKQTNIVPMCSLVFFSLLFAGWENIYICIAWILKERERLVRHHRYKEIVKIYSNMQMLYMLDVNARWGHEFCVWMKIWRTWQRKQREKEWKKNFMTACNVNIVFLYVRVPFTGLICVIIIFFHLTLSVSGFSLLSFGKLRRRERIFMLFFFFEVGATHFFLFIFTLVVI